MPCSARSARAISAGIFRTPIRAIAAPTAACSCATSPHMMRAAGFKLVNADITVLAEAPRIAAHRGAIAANLAADLGRRARLHQHQSHHHRAHGIHRAGRGTRRARGRPARRESVSIRGRRSEAWTRAALSPPRAHGAPLRLRADQGRARGLSRRRGAFLRPLGRGPALAAAASRSAPPIRAGWPPRSRDSANGRSPRSAMQDSRIATPSHVQWFSVPGRQHPAEFWSGVRTDEFRVLERACATRAS